MKPVITILGPTATGKTKLAVQVSQKYGGEIVSADSRQVYRGMDIGTGKDLSEYIVEGEGIPYHMIDIVDPGCEYNVFKYQQKAITTIKDIQSKARNVILCGGSGMYIDALLKGYKLFPVPENLPLREKLSSLHAEELSLILQKYRSLHNKTDIETRERAIRAIEIEEYYSRHPELQETSIAVPSVIFGLCGDRDVIRNKITLRLRERLASGMIEEVQKLLEAGVDPGQLIRYGLEYKYVTLFLLKEIGYDDMFQKLNIAIHQFSKRQMTWFRKMERDGFLIHWIDIAFPDEKKLEIIDTTLEFKS